MSVFSESCFIQFSENAKQLHEIQQSVNASSVLLTAFGWDVSSICSQTALLIQLIEWHTSLPISVLSLGFLWTFNMPGSDKPSIAGELEAIRGIPVLTSNDWVNTGSIRTARFIDKNQFLQF